MQFPRRPIQLMTCLFGIVPSGFAAAKGGAQADAERFIQYEINTGTLQKQTVLPGYFLGGATADLAVIYRDEIAAPRLQLYGFDGSTWRRAVNTRLGQDVTFVDTARLGGRDRIITYEHGQLNWFDPDAGVERALVRVPLIRTVPNERGIPRINIFRDLNGNGRDDVIVPGLDSFHAVVQLPDGRFAAPVKLGPPEPFQDQIAVDGGDKRPYGEIGVTPETLPAFLGRVHQFDYNGDGRLDLVFWNRDHFDVYHQDERGTFGAVNETFTPSPAFDSDGQYSLLFGFAAESSFRLMTGFRKKSRRTALHSFLDVDGDGVPDLITRTMEGRSLLSQKTTYNLHFGTRTDRGVVFEGPVSTFVRQRGSQPLGYAVERFIDVDGDGQLELLLLGVKTGVIGLARVITANTIGVDLAVYHLEDRHFPDQPDGFRKVRPDPDRFGRPGPFFPTVLVGDISGDGRADLLVGQNRTTLNLYRGQDTAALFAPEPTPLRVDLPDDESKALLYDLTGDGRQDLLLLPTSSREDAALLTVCLAQ